MTSREKVQSQLIALAHDLGDGRQMSILGEGNISGSLDDRRFLVKASGTQYSVPQILDSSLR